MHVCCVVVAIAAAAIVITAAEVTVTVDVTLLPSHCGHFCTAVPLSRRAIESWLLSHCLATAAVPLQCICHCCDIQPITCPERVCDRA